MASADVVVIGAGVNGASTAYNLVKAGAARVVLVEKYLMASGGTGRSAAIVRQHYSTEVLVRMMLRSIQVFHHFDDIVGGSAGFVDCGYAFLVPDSSIEGFRRNLQLQQSLGVNTRVISKQDLLELEPRLDLSDVAQICYEPGSGYADPYDTTYTYVRRFRELGGELLQMTSVTGLIRAGGAVKGVRTSAGDIAAGAVVNAAGPWAHTVAQWAGLDVSLTVTREEEVILDMRDAGGPPRLVVSDGCRATYYRPVRPSQTLVGRGFPKDYQEVDPDHFKESADSEFIQDVTARVTARFPSFEQAQVIRAYTGLYDVSRDWHPILGKVDGVEGLYMCFGFSGHGFKIAPAVGELMAQEILDGAAHSIDIGSLRLERFAKGELLQGAYGGNRA